MLLKLTLLVLSCSLMIQLNNAASCPNIVSRAEWGAKAPSSTLGSLSTGLQYTIIHHSEGSHCTTKESCMAQVKGFQNYHMNSNGWSDIGYNFIVGEDGNVYEGRGWSKKGAHHPSYNSQSIGICIIGTYKSKLPNSLAMKAVKDLIECGVDKGYIRSAYTLKGHRDGRSTDCPGDALYNEIKTWPKFASGTSVYTETQTTTNTGGCPNIVSRAEWGARSPSSTLGSLSKGLQYAIIHHSEGSHCTTKSSCIAQVKGFQNYHMNSNGWSDIGYNFIVGEDGNVYEGRGWSKKGAHHPNYNSQSIGISIIGNYKSKLPNSLAMKAVKDLIACGIDKGYIRSAYTLKGHRDGRSTDCPGNTLYNEIKTWPRFASGTSVFSG